MSHRPTITNCHFFSVRARNFFSFYEGFLFFQIIPSANCSAFLSFINYYDGGFKVVPTLENLAIAAAYKAIENDLSLCYGHGSSGKRLYTDCPESDRIRQRVRSHLDQTLGVNTEVSDKVRESFLKTHNYDIDCEKANIADFWLLLDCVLWETCEKISSAAASDRLTSVISKRSPSLMKLGITFHAMGRISSSRELEWKMSALIRPLASLKFLTRLCLSEMTPSATTSVMGLIGEAGLSLSSLVIKYSYGSNPELDMLALIMGRSVYLLKTENRPSWFLHGELGRTDVPNEYRTQLCLSLRVLDYGSLGWSASLAAFTLRNIPFLQEFGYATSRGGIEMLHHQQQQQGVNNSFQGHLSLTKVDKVDVHSGSMLRAIGDLCPSLNEAYFSGRDPKVEADELSPEEAEAILRKWPKLAKIGLYLVNREYVKRILKVFGPELLHLTINSREEDRYNLADFALCPKLKSLDIYDCTLDEEEDVTDFDPATFLPNLKSFASDCCLGSLSRFFEAKSSLISLNVHCSHVGLEFKKGRPLYAEVESVLKGIWDRETWTHLETLSINEYVCLSMDKMARILPQLRRLKTVFLPQTIPSCDVLLYESIKNELSNRKPPALIHFRDCYKSRKPYLCVS